MLLHVAVGSRVAIVSTGQCRFMCAQNRFSFYHLWTSREFPVWAHVTRTAFSHLSSECVHTPFSWIHPQMWNC